MLVRKKRALDDLFADSQDFAKEEDGGHVSDHSVNKRNKVGEPITDIVASIPGAAMAAVMPLAVVPPVLKEEGLEFGLMMQQMVRMQQIQMENQIQMQQTFLEQFVRCLPMNLGGTSSRLPSTVFQAPNLPVVSGPAACPPTVLDSSGLTPEQWASAVETPPVIEAKALDGSASKHYVKVARKFEENVLRYQNSDRNLRQVRADIDEMKNSSVKFRYPPGTRRWKSPGDGVQLDQLWIQSKEEDYVVSIVAPKGIDS